MNTLFPCSDSHLVQRSQQDWTPIPSNPEQPNATQPQDYFQTRSSRGQYWISVSTLWLCSWASRTSPCSPSPHIGNRCRQSVTSLLASYRQYWMFSKRDSCRQWNSLPHTHTTHTHTHTHTHTTHHTPHTHTHTHTHTLPPVLGVEGRGELGGWKSVCLYKHASHAKQRLLKKNKKKPQKKNRDSWKTQRIERRGVRGTGYIQESENVSSMLRVSFDNFVSFWVAERERGKCSFINTNSQSHSQGV